MNEEHLIRSAQKDIKNFDKIYNLYFDKIRSYIKARVNSDHYVADDLTSETFEKALKNLKGFKWQGISFSAWIYKIACNTLIDYYRKQNTRKHKGELHENIDDKSPSIEQRSIQLDSESRIKFIIDQLPQREKQILLLKFYEGYTNQSISRKLDLSETNVSSIIHRSMKKIRNAISRGRDINI